MNRRIGVMGGTFNPIHMGHLILAEHAWDEFGLDEVLFMPSARPPHKTKGVLPDEIRKDMVMLAIEENEHFTFSSMEYERDGITYTIDTIRELKKENPTDTFYFIIGADSFYDLESWSSPKELMQETEFLVATRDGHTKEELEQHRKRLEEKYQAKISFISFPMLDISSSSIRKRVLEGKSIRYYVPRKVKDYIYEKQLYQD